MTTDRHAIVPTRTLAVHAFGNPVRVPEAVAVTPAARNRGERHA